MKPVPHDPLLLVIAVLIIVYLVVDYIRNISKWAEGEDEQPAENIRRQLEVNEKGRLEEKVFESEVQDCSGIDWESSTF